MGYRNAMREILLEEIWLCFNKVKYIKTTVNVSCKDSVFRKAFLFLLAFSE